MAEPRDLELIELWETAQAAHPLMRPLLLLQAGGDNDAEQLPIGLRDRRLLTIRERWFGSGFEGVAQCPHCGSLVEMSFDSRAIATPGADPIEPFTCVADGAEIVIRLPNTRDLLAVAACTSEGEARARLAACCVVSAVDSLSEAAVGAIATAMEQHDPNGDLRAAIRCPDCAASWEISFDPGSYLWREVESEAMRVFREVDALATAYGWSETDILAMSPARRAVYLDMVTR